MVRVSELRNGNLDSEGQRSSYASFPSTISSQSTGLPARDLGPLPETYIRRSLAEIAPLTFEAIARMCTAEVEVVKVIEEPTKRTI